MLFFCKEQAQKLSGFQKIASVNKANMFLKRTLTIEIK
jgi:hypothetical protein